MFIPVLAMFVLLIGGLIVFYRFLFNHLGLVILFVVGGTLATWLNLGSTNIVKIIGANEATVAEVYGRPESCANGGYTVTCNYDSMAVTYVNGRATEANYRRLNYMEFRTNRDFYAKVLGMLELPYREPDVANMNEIVWRIPGFGTITATSDEDMDVAGIVIRG
jgi:hypothetical protein